MQVTPPTGEPDAGDPHVRFGGRGDRNQSMLPTPISNHRPGILDRSAKPGDDSVARVDPNILTPSPGKAGRARRRGRIETPIYIGGVMPFLPTLMAAVSTSPFGNLVPAPMKTFAPGLR